MHLQRVYDNTGGGGGGGVSGRANYSLTEKFSFLETFIQPFGGQSFIKTERGPLRHLHYCIKSYCHILIKWYVTFEPQHEISNNVVCRTSKVSKGAKIRDRYNQVPHLTQDTKGKVTNSQLDTTNESQEVTLIRAFASHLNIICLLSY